MKLKLSIEFEIPDVVNDLEFKNLVQTLLTEDLQNRIRDDYGGEALRGSRFQSVLIWQR